MNTQKNGFYGRFFFAAIFVLPMTSFIEISSMGLPAPFAGGSGYFGRPPAGVLQVSSTEPILMLPRTAFNTPAAFVEFQAQQAANMAKLVPSAPMSKLMLKSKFVGPGLEVPRMGPKTQQEYGLRRVILLKQNIKADDKAYGKELAKQIAKDRLAERIASQAKLARVMVTPGYAALSAAPVLGGLAWKGLTADTSEIQAQLKELENARMPAVAESWGEHKRAQAYWDKQAAAEVAAKVAAFNAEQAAAQVPAPGRWESFRSGLSDALTGAGSRFANVRQSVGDWYTRGSEGLRGYLPKSLQDRVTSGQVGAAAALTGAALTGAAAYGINRYRKAQAEKRRLEQEAAEDRNKTDV